MSVKDQIERYAAAERSDPFARARAIAHSKNEVGYVKTDYGRAFAYDAELTSERRDLPPGIALSNGDTHFTVDGYKNIKRS